MKDIKVLFVDDELKILSSIRRSTMEENFETLTAISGEKALEIMENEKITILVTDMRMPEMDGLTLLKITKEKYPDIVRIVLSGYNQLPQILSTINQVGVFKFITKPWLVEEEFLPAIREAIEYYKLRKEGEEVKKALENRNIMYQSILKSSNEVINNIRNDMNNVQKLYDSIQKLNKALYSSIKSPDSLLSQMESYNTKINNIFSGYLNTLPSKIENFTLEKLITEVKNIDYLDFSYPKFDKSLNYTGNYNLISYIITTLTKYLLEVYNNKEFKLELLENMSKNNISFEINKSKNLHINFNDNDLKIIIYLLNTLNSSINGLLNYDQESIKVQFNFAN